MPYPGAARRPFFAPTPSYRRRGRLHGCPLAPRSLGCRSPSIVRLANSVGSNNKMFRARPSAPSVGCSLQGRAEAAQMRQRPHRSFIYVASVVSKFRHLCSLICAFIILLLEKKRRGERERERERDERLLLIFQRLFGSDTTIRRKILLIHYNRIDARRPRCLFTAEF